MSKDKQTTTSVGDKVAKWLNMGPEDPEVTRLKLEKANSKKSEKREKALHKKNVKQQGEKPKYEKDLEAARLAEDELEGLTGTDTALLTVSTAISDAVDLAADGKYIEAREILKNAKIAALLSSAREQDGVARKKADKDFPKETKLAATLRIKIGESTAFSDAERQDLLDRLAKAEAPLLLPGADGETGKQANVDIAGVANRMMFRTEACRSAEQRAKVALKEVEEFFDETRDILDVDDAAELNRSLNGARTQLSEREFEDAADALEELRDRTVEARKELKTANNAWAKCAFAMKAVLKQAQDLANRDDVPPLRQETPYASAAPRRLKELTQLVAERKIYVGDAIDVFEECRADIRINTQRVKDYQESEKDRAAAVLEVGVAVSAVEFALGQLSHVVSEIDDGDFPPDQLAAPFVQELATLRKVWEASVVATCDAKLLDRQGTVDALHDLEDRIKESFETPESLQELCDEKLKRDLEDAVAACERKLDALAQLDVEAGERKLGQFGGLRTKALQAATPKAIAQMNGRVAIFSARLDQLILGTKLVATSLQDEIAPKLEAVTKLLKVFTDLIEKKKKEDDYGGMRDRFAGELEEQRLLARVSDGQILEEVESALDTLFEQIGHARDALNGTSPTGDEVLTVKDIRKALASRRKLVAKGDVATYLQATQAELADGLDAIEEDIGSKLPDDSSSLLDAWDKRFGLAKTAAADAKSKHEEFAKEVKKVENELKKPEFKEAKALQAELSGKLKACLEAGREQDGLDDAKKKLTDLAGEIDTALKDPQVVKDGEKSAIAAKRQAELDAAEWKSLRELAEKRITEVTAFRSKQRSEVQELVKGADKAFKGNADLDAARRQLRAAEARLDFYEKYPKGIEMAARESIGRVVEAWRASVVTLKAEMDVVAQAVSSLPKTDLDDDGKKAVQGEIDLLKALINPGAFDSASAAMSQDGRDYRKMRAVRETALQDVSRMLVYFEKDPRFQALGAKNPFSGKVRSEIVVARLNLLKVEKTFLTSL